MKIKKDDYIVVRPPKGRNFLVKVSSASDSVVSGIVERDCHIQERRTLIDVPVKDVVLNLGSEPAPGTVYGINLNHLYRGRKSHEAFGMINFFYRPKKEVTKELMKGFDKVERILNKNGLVKLIADNIVWEIEAYAKEKYAGMYYRAKDEKSFARIKFKPEILPATQHPYVILHELGHHFHIHYLMKNHKLDAQWIKLYNTSIKVMNINKSVSQQLLDSLLEGDDRPSDLRGQLDEESTLAYKWILRVIQATHSLSVRELDRLFEADMKDEISNVWPLYNIRKKDLAPVVSEYATKNYRELVAESFSMHLIGKELPKNVIKLLEKSISYVKTQF